jgi:microcystin-dependent protein
MEDAYLGTIVLFAGNFPPRGWMFCHGQLLSIMQNTALFSVIGTTYGGNGTSNFALPDLRGRVPVGFGEGPGLSKVTIGEQGGVETVTLLRSQLPAHNHPLNVTAPPTGAAATAGNVSAFGGAVATQTSPAVSVLADPAAQGLPHENRQPFLGLNYIIAVQGLFPVRE